MSNNYEHLLSQDPIGAFDKIKANYIRYFKSAFRISDQELNKERVDLLEKDDNLYKSPYLELLPEYNSYEGIDDIGELADRFAEAFGSSDVARQFFEDFIKTGLMRYVPYVHQVDMLEKVFRPEPGRFGNAVITTGTGSGKTEAFLLPLFAQLFKEAKTWGRVDNDPNWYCRTDRGHLTYYNPCQRERDDLGGHVPALRALVMYPMNALVEDQMARLRKALDSDEIRQFMDSEEGLKGNRIYFGSYNGSTVGMKNYDLIYQYGPLNSRGQRTTFNKAREALKKKLGVIHDQFSSVCDYYGTFVDAEREAESAVSEAEKVGDEEAVTKTRKAYEHAKDARKTKEEVLYTAPRLGGDRATAEMVTRWDMQNWAPDILITNVSMLSIMLMREAERNIFTQTRDWLAAKDLPEGARAEAKKNRIFHIVIDELHLYRDTAGSETACLIRMLLKAIGLTPVMEDGTPNPQLRVLASSASLGSVDATHRFLEEFFGVYNSGGDGKAFSIIPDESGYCSDYAPEKGEESIDYEKFTIFTEDFVTLEEDTKVTKMNELASQFKCTDAVSFIQQYEKTIFADFLSAGCRHGVKLDDLISSPDKKVRLFKSREALRGFLIFRAYADHLTDADGAPIKHRLPRIRFHQFFKYIEGLWGELKAPAQGPHHSPVQSLSYVSREVGPHNGKVLELLRCECCGELFIGGNRKVRDAHTYLTLNYPSLGTIPNYNPTPMVQNKTFEEYALFWPSEKNQESIPLPKDNDHMSMQYSNETSYSATGVRAQWRHAYLHVYTGEVREDRPMDGSAYIKGFILKTERYGQASREPDLSLVHALPCCCPHCNQNYTKRRYVKSPIRSFRTGIDRSNQLLSKELMYQLNAKSSKLIGFSDSRQDAAKQALGIEVEHYRDMVRMLFIQSVTEADEGVQNLVRFINEEKRTHPNNRREVKRLAMQRFSNENIDAIVDAVYDDPDELRNYISDTISLTSLIGHGNNMDGILLKKLVGLGINPAGPEFKYQQFCVSDSSERQHWSRAFDYATCCMRADLQFKDTDDAALNYNTIKNGLSSAVFENSFGKYMGVSTIDAGLGYICCSHTQNVMDSAEYRRLEDILSPLGINTFDFIDAFIRVLGDNHRFVDPDSTLEQWTSFSEFSSTVRKPIERFMEKHQFDEGRKAALMSGLYNFLFQHVSGVGTILDFNSLSFRTLSSESTYYICPQCGRVHPNKGFGICTNSFCLTDLSDDPEFVGKVGDLQQDHFISFDILQEPREPRRLHTEELTGQTDNIQERLLNFKDIVLLDGVENRFRPGFEASKPIDMVNVTTTMEVGVDIGSLEAIFQGNMPPTRYNYQQRVGRGGRRGQAFSVAVTFCRGRSHDVYYYQKATDRIVGGMPAPPELSLAPFQEMDAQGNVSYHMKLAIMKRVIVKDLLNQAYSDLPYDYDLKDNCGEFGRVGQWTGRTRAILAQWIAGDGEKVIDDTVDFYFSQFNRPGVDITQDIAKVKAWIRNDLVSSIDRSLVREHDLSKGLAQCLSELGYLPMYGMPSDVREFYHGTGKKYGQNVVNSIDRSTELAITEFAPGSEKTKDKGVYRVEALTLPMDFREEDGKDKLKFFYKDDDPDEDKNALKDRYIITYDHDMSPQNHEGNIVDIVPVPAGSASALETSRGLGRNQRLIVIPRAYRSNKVFNNNGTPVENSDRSSSFSQCQIWAKDDVTNGNVKDVRNVRLSAYGLGLNNDAEVWHVNSNNNRFFRGRFARLYPDGSGDSSLSPNFTFYDREKEILHPVSEKSSDSFEIALGSRKPTEMICLALKDCRDELCLDVRDEPKCNVAAVRAAFYSAAFLLQRALADKLDVQPEEIEISEKKSTRSPYPVIYLSDALPNGAGIVSHLAQEGRLEQIIEEIVSFKTDFMKSLLAEDHRKSCRTACQNCLLSYGNRGYHHVLDWRMGVGILRLMIDPDYDFGFNANDRSRYPELCDYDELVVAAAKKASVDLQPGEWFTLIQTSEDELGEDDTQVGKVFYHPLWDKARTIEKAAFDENVGIEMYNIFNLLRSNLDDDRIPPVTNNSPSGEAAQKEGQAVPCRRKASRRSGNSSPSDTSGNEDEIIEL